jgi:hypothetical protein
VWDGLKDGFAALVNYHKLDHKKLGPVNTTADHQRRARN